MRLSNKTTVITLLVLMVVILVQCTSSTNDSPPATKPTEFSEYDVSKGQEMAAQYCQSCHKLPDPSLLDKETWARHILPAMRSYLGIHLAAPAGRIPNPGDDEYYQATRPTITPAQWKQLGAYYITRSPEHLPPLHQAAPIHQLPFFEIKPTPAEWVSTQSLTSFVKIDTSVVPHRLIVCDGLSNRLIILNDKVQTIKSSILDGPIVDLLFQKNKIIATTIGPDLAANNFKVGNIREINIDKKGTVTPQAKPIFQQLSRPVSVDMVDLNQDGKKDYLVAQFGKMIGRLSWFEGFGKNSKEHILRDKPGCLKTIIDYGNKSKRPDIWALFSQGDEGIFLYTNDGKGNFEEKRVLSFPPSYGSTSFDLVDFNGDGFKDIIYTCGDNADFSQILKPYHGVYIYLNDGKNNFTQKYFYPIYGCSKAIVKDFDGDGDLDIATISEFPGHRETWEAFVYFENKGGLKFQTYTLPLTTRFTRGMTMDAADIDGDGKTDLLLGAGFAADDLKGNDKQPLFVLLKNISPGAGKAIKRK